VLQATVVGLKLIVGIAIGAVPGAGSSSPITSGYVGARSVTTSAGITLVVPIARSKNHRAALASRRAETNTSTTYPD
jgi:hypothetical protein